MLLYNFLFIVICVYRIQEVKDIVISQINAEAEQYLGTAMTYTLFEFVKEKLEELLTAQPENLIEDTSDSIENLTISETQVGQALCSI